YANTKSDEDKSKKDKSIIKLSGLNPDKQYEIVYFSSRTAKDQANRETKFVTRGIKQVISYLDASNNDSKLAAVKNIKPDADGNIYITLTAGPKNTDKNGFYYLNAMSIRVKK